MDVAAEQAFDAYRSSGVYSASSLPKTKVTTKTFDFSIGNFGFKYTSKDVEVVDKSSEPLKKFRENSYKRIQEQNQEIESLKQRMSAAKDEPQKSSRSQAASRNRQRQGLLAYTANKTVSDPHMGQYRTTLAIV